jgi:hypothetical protein
MIGGPWVDTFYVVPSFGGVPATYTIDGGPGGKNQLIARVPAGENVTFENSIVVDKYTSTLKALAVQANAGLSATAHGIQKVHIVSVPGASVVLGDTSELDIAFSISGSANLTFGGTNAPDVFAVSTSGSFYNAENGFTPPKWANGPSGLVIPGGGFQLPSRFPDPVYLVTRTFGTNGRTQTIPFAVRPGGSSIALNAGGASDSYTITLGVGAFVDVTVDDSDAANQNGLTVNVRDSVLAMNQVVLTDNAVHLDYYTEVVFHDALSTGGSGTWNYFAYSSSVHYTTSVFFGANMDVTFASALPFVQTIVNRPSAPQPLTIRIDGQSYTSFIPYRSFGPLSDIVFDTLAQVPTSINYTLLPHTVEIQANGGDLIFEQTQMLTAAPGFIAISAINIHSNTGSLSFNSNRVWSDGFETYNVLGNAGTLNLNSLIIDASPADNIARLSRVVNVRGSSGTVNVSDNYSGGFFLTGINTQVNVGSEGSLTGVHGVITLTNGGGSYGLKIDDRGGSAAEAAWAIDSTRTQIGDLTINHSQGGSFGKYEAFPRASSPVTIFGDPFFPTRQLNGAAFPTWLLVAPSPQVNRTGDAVNVTPSLIGNPGGPVTYSASNLPLGLSINPTTGLISGTIAELAFLNSPYATKITANNGTFTRGWAIDWQVNSAISILAEIPNGWHGRELTTVALGPITTTNTLNRPVTLTVSGLPPGLSFNPATGMITGTIGLGAGQHGPYEVTINATDGSQTAAASIPLPVTGITITAPPLLATVTGASVNLQLQATSASGAPVALSVQNLPNGLSFSPATGLITGVVIHPFEYSVTHNTTVTATQGNDVFVHQIVWTTVPVLTESTDVTIFGPGNRNDSEGASINAGIAYDYYAMPMYVEVQGLPPGLELVVYPEFGYYYQIEGTIESGAASHSPYQISVFATNGLDSKQATFQWTVNFPGTVSVVGPADQLNLVNDTVNLSIQASSSLSQPLTYSASGLPDGLSIHPQTGVISGTVSPLASLPSTFNVIVSVTDGTSTYDAGFSWQIASTQPNVVSLPKPGGGGFFNVIAPVGTSLTASITVSPGVALPTGVNFPFGFVDFVISGVAPGGTADLVISGLDPASITDYFKYGATPANSSPHWYNFLFGVPTDGDSAVGTGMEIVGGDIVLHLKDGGRGDDDLALNGVIYDIGGPATSQPAHPGDFDLDGDVDGADFVAWQTNFPKASGATRSQGDADGDADVDGADFVVWQTNFPFTPSPASIGGDESNPTSGDPVNSNGQSTRTGSAASSQSGSASYQSSPSNSPNELNQAMSSRAGSSTGGKAKATEYVPDIGSGQSSAKRTLNHSPRKTNTVRTTERLIRGVATTVAASLDTDRDNHQSSRSSQSNPTSEAIEPSPDKPTRLIGSAVDQVLVDPVFDRRLPKSAAAPTAIDIKSIDRLFAQNQG